VIKTQSAARWFPTAGGAQRARVAYPLERRARHPRKAMATPQRPKGNHSWGLGNPDPGGVPCVDPWSGWDPMHVVAVQFPTWNVP
jgi:hypothetical protein